MPHHSKIMVNIVFLDCSLQLYKYLMTNVFPSYLLFFHFESQCNISLNDGIPSEVDDWRYAREVWSLKLAGSAIKDGSIRLGYQKGPTVLLNVSFHQFLLVCRQLMVKKISQKMYEYYTFTTCIFGLLGYFGPSLWRVLFSAFPPAHHEHFCSTTLLVLSFTPT